jgi:S-DNA-T family DNA segregation ATPase FtsK/SpoIIIE
LLTPVITNAKQALLALKWSAKEMDRRYDILESKKVRDIDSYHQNIVLPAYKKAEKKAAQGHGDVDESKDGLPERMPYIVIVIDELADLMQAYPRELEAAVVRIAQMSRAVGIHLVLSTQRPSVNIITGLIKANIPARIALQVASQIDSRTILDMSGAESLLGAGDMLFVSGEMSKPMRLQSAFITEQEVKRVVDFIKKQYDGELQSDMLLAPVGNGGPMAMSLDDMERNEQAEAEDELYEEARETVLAAKKASTSLLQRKLRIGYGRAARLIDMLEERGVVGPADGAKGREILAELGYDENNNL